MTRYVEEVLRDLSLWDKRECQASVELSAGA